MIIAKQSDLKGTARDAAGPGWESLRLLVRSDGMGFSVNDTLVLPGASLKLEYKHHLEACYCISGIGIVVDLATGARHDIAPGTLYALDQHDQHEVHVPAGGEPLRLVSVFLPGLEGDEVHGRDGSYPAPVDRTRI